MNSNEEILIRLTKIVDRHNRYIEQIKNDISSEKLQKAVSRLIADIQNELNDESISPSKERSFPSIYDSEPGDVVLSVGVYPVRLEGVYEDHDYTVIVGLALKNRILKK